MFLHVEHAFHCNAVYLLTRYDCAVGVYGTVVVCSVCMLQMYCG